MGSRPPPPPLGEALFELGVKRPVFATCWNISQRDSRKAPPSQMTGQRGLVAMSPGTWTERTMESCLLKRPVALVENGPRVGAHALRDALSTSQPAGPLPSTSDPACPTHASERWPSCGNPSPLPHLHQQARALTVLPSWVRALLLSEL